MLLEKANADKDCLLAGLLIYGSMEVVGERDQNGSQVWSGKLK